MPAETSPQKQDKHTWHPSGSYETISTPITREDVVPIELDPVRSPSPLEIVPPPVEEKTVEVEPSRNEEPLEFTSPLHPLTNEDGTPIAIPDGIPLLARIFPAGNEDYKGSIPLERIFTPANDFEGFAHKKKKLFASSDFYGPNHPTIDDQLELAHKISDSLMDTVNNTSKGQEMYERRKQKSHKWINHEGGTVVENTIMDTETSETIEMKQSTQSKSKLKLVLSSNTVHDQHTMYDQSQLKPVVNFSDLTPAKLGDVQKIGNDLNSPTGRGAELFAKRKKLMDKFIVDETNVERSVYRQEENLSQMSSSINQTQNGGTTVYTAEVKVQQSSHPSPDISLVQHDSSSTLTKSSSKQTTSSSVSEISQPIQAPTPVKLEEQESVVAPVHKLAKYDAEITDDKDKLYNFNFAASGFGTYPKFYRPISFVVTKY